METIGDRVKEAAKVVGGLNSLAKTIGIPRRTLGDQISGKFKVKLPLVMDVAAATGFSANWLMTGEGEMFADPSKAPPPTVQVDPDVLAKLHNATRRAYMRAGLWRPGEEGLADDVGKLYNALLAKVSDIRDTLVVDAVIPPLIADFIAQTADTRPQGAAIDQSALAKRLQEIRLKTEMSPRTFSAKLESVAEETLLNIESGVEIPDAAILQAYRKALNVNINWLVTGEGAPYVPEHPIPENLIPDHLLVALAGLPAKKREKTFSMLEFYLEI